MAEKRKLDNENNTSPHIVLLKQLQQPAFSI